MNKENKSLKKGLGKYLKERENEDGPNLQDCKRLVNDCIGNG